MDYPIYESGSELENIVSQASTILIVQADNPDADSLGSALALESIFGEMGKNTFLYCGVDAPSYLRYMSGWDRVSNEIPNDFDLSVIVDASTLTLLERLQKSGKMDRLSVKPSIVLDHHETVENLVPFATLMINDHERASTGELIYLLSKQLNWKLTTESNRNIMSSILGDTQGLSNQLASATTYRIMAEIIDTGVSRPLLEEQRREYSKMPPIIYNYKADLIKRTKFYRDGTIAYVKITQNEITNLSPLYNPAPLIQNDMLQIEKVCAAIVFKSYDDGKVTAAIRCNASTPIGAKLAKKFGGGGHPFASGFKVVNANSYVNIENECLKEAAILLDSIENDHSNI